MNTAHNHPASEKKAGASIDKLERQMAASGDDGDAASADLAQEDIHWFENYATRPYVEAGQEYEDYAPAYLYGVVWYQSNPQRQFDDSEGDLANGWESARRNSPLDWPKAKPAARDAWYRVRDLANQAKSERTELLSRSPTAQTPGDH